LKENTMQTGSCLCGAVAFEIHGPMRPVLACHCTQCRKTSGHYWAATEVATPDLKIIRDDGLKWYRSSASARRGFCAHCGASLFWEREGEGQISIGAGTLNGATGLTMQKHIFVADKGDYYDIGDQLPQEDQ
jgi:hypothetical protein